MGKSAHTDIAVDGVADPAAAKCVGKSAKRVRRAARTAKLNDLAQRRGGKQVTIRGVTYESFAAAGRALGVTASAVRSGYRNGTLHRVGTGRTGVEPMRVCIAGRMFETAQAAALHYGVNRMSIYAAISDGDPDRIARKPVYNPARAEPFEIGGFAFSSMRAASRALGFENEEYIAKVIKQGSKRGRERIIAAGMRYAAMKAGCAP